MAMISQNLLVSSTLVILTPDKFQVTYQCGDLEFCFQIVFDVLV